MKQTIEIEVPEGKIAVLRDNRVVFEQVKVPITWEEYCKSQPLGIGEYYIGTNSGIITYNQTVTKMRHPEFDSNLLASTKDAQAHLAYIKLHRLRDYYRQGWVPDWEDANIDKYCIVNCKGLFITNYTTYVRFLSFQSQEIAEEFLKNFKNLIEEAGDLI